MGEKFYNRIVELYALMIEIKDNRSFSEEEIVLYNRLGSLLSTWALLQETGFKIQQFEANAELEKREKENNDN